MRSATEGLLCANTGISRAAVAHPGAKIHTKASPCT